MWVAVALEYSLKSRSVIPSALFFFLKTALSIQRLLCVSIQILELSVLVLWENAFGILTRIALSVNNTSSFSL